MRKLRVGIILRDDYSPTVGGGFSYTSYLINKIRSTKFNNAEIVYFSKNEILKLDNINLVNKLPVKKRLNLFLKVILKCASIIGFAKIVNILKSIENKYEKELSRQLYSLIDLFYFPTSWSSFTNYPYIYTMWDIGHLNSFAFPELSMKGAFDHRKKIHDYEVQKALMVLVESETGKKQAQQYLNLNPDRIRIIPLFPSQITEEVIIAKKPTIQNFEFIFYPAQFWAHKNHFNLLHAFKILLNDFPNLKLIFTGSDHGNKEYISKVINSLKLEDSVIDLGFVEITELKWLYLNALGLVMPTLLGPTNMPLLEAAELGCSVACSNLEGHREQLGDYAYYFDPLNIENMYSVILEMIFDKREKRIKTYKSKFNIDNAIESLDRVFGELRNIRFCWGNDGEFI